MNYVDASAITFSDMGSMGGGRSPDSPDGFSGGFPGQPPGNQAENSPPENFGTSGNNNTDYLPAGNMHMPGGDFRFDTNETGSPPSNLTGWVWIAVSAVVLAFGLAVAKKYKH